MKSSVSIVKCQSYDEEEVLKGLQRAIHLIGGIARVVRKGDRVLLKPNLLYGKAPERAVTTHPSIVKGMIQIVREAGGIPFIGESPAIESLKRAAKKSGIADVADKTGCPLIEFNKPIVSPKGEGRYYKQFEVDQTVFEADVIINLPKWKTHGMTLLTLGVKNLLGCVPGPKKALWHLKAGENNKLFAQMLVDLYQVIRPHLTILDGIVGMEGDGPGSGRPIPLGLILVSRDPLSLDQIVCDLLGISRDAVLTNQAAFEEGFGKELIEVMGEKIEEVRIPHFLLPEISEPTWNLPEFLKKALKNGLTSKPVFEEERCNACNQCIEICPPKTIYRREDSLRIDYRKCIRCFCCQEICPEGAIKIKPGWALKYIKRWHRA